LTADCVKTGANSPDLADRSCHRVSYIGDDVGTLAGFERAKLSVVDQAREVASVEPDGRGDIDGVLGPRILAGVCRVTMPAIERIRAGKLHPERIEHVIVPTTLHEHGMLGRRLIKCPREWHAFFRKVRLVPRRRRANPLAFWCDGSALADKVDELGFVFCLVDRDITPPRVRRR
jgi:hypothetical protein